MLKYKGKELSLIMQMKILNTQRDGLFSFSKVAFTWAELSEIICPYLENAFPSVFSGPPSLPPTQ